MVRRPRLRFALPLLALSAGCSLDGTTGPPAGALQPGETAIRTDRDRYALRTSPVGVETEIRLEFTNPTARTIQVAGCQDSFALRLEQRTGGRWVTAWTPPLLLCLGIPIEIRPGRSWSHTVRVFGGHRDTNVYPKFKVDPIGGTYRLVFEAAHWRLGPPDTSQALELPLEYRVSNTFELVEP